MKGNSLWLLAVLLVASAHIAEAQQAKKVHRIGILIPGSQAAYATRIAAIHDGLRELGYVEGQNIATEIRFAEGTRDRYAGLAADLVRSNVDVIVTTTTPVAEAAQRATRTIPIVMAASGDPVATGLVNSLARPGGNVTGLSMQGTDTDGRVLELLQETVPKLVRVGYLWDPTNAAITSRLRAVEAIGRSLQLQIQGLEVSTPSKLENTLESAISHRVDALFVPAALSSLYRKRIVAFTVKQRLPSMYNDSESAEAGGLMSYGVSLPALFYRAATYVDKILKGAKPADLPVQQPTKFELVINLKAAKQINLMIPPNVLARADRVIR